MAPLELAEPGGPALAILFGSQSGTSEEVAWDLAREGRKAGVPCRDPQALNEVSVQTLCSLRFAVFVVATTGQGDPPVNMRRLWQELCVASLPKTLLADLHFSVFGMGDSHYREFNYAARKLDARLRGLGAKQLFRLGLGDDQHDFGFEQELDPWAEGMWEALAQLLPSQPKADGGPSAEPELRYTVEVVGELPAGEASVRPEVGAPGDGEFLARVTANRSLCLEEHRKDQQDVINIRLSTPSGRSYVAGDVAVVHPCTDPLLVRRFVVETLERNPRTLVRVRPAPRAGVEDGGSIFPDAPLTLEQIFTSYLDIGAVPTRHFFNVLAHYTDHELHKKKLAEFGSRALEAKLELYEYCKRERRSCAEIMWDFWTTKPPLDQLLSALPPMRPRRYSIASCPKWYDEGLQFEVAARWWVGYQRACGSAARPRLESRACIEAFAEATRRRQRQKPSGAGEGPAAGCSFDLCVGVVTYVTKTAREGHGLCSYFLQQAAEDSLVRCSFESGTLSLPPLDVPLILVCPGTGLSPCRALVQERHLEVLRTGAAAAGRFSAGLKDLMFLGFRHEAGDFLYGEEWPVYSPWLSVHTAFSRDHEDRKVYVQDKIEEQGAHVCRLLDAGARIYVCGRSHPMPSQVFDSFAEVLEIHRGLSRDAAAARLREMQRAQRYICDTWG